MANQDNDNLSESSFADSQYDMLTPDDISDISNNDAETASIASTDADHNDGQLTPEGSIHAETAYSYVLQSPSSFIHVTTDRDDHDGATAAQTFQSYASEDLETPRQSTVADMAHLTRTHLPDTSPRSLKASKRECGHKSVSDLVSGISTESRTLLVQIGTSLLSAILVFWLSGIFSSPVAMTITRREALNTTFPTYTNSTDFINAVNLDHLLPIPTPVTTNLVGYPVYNKEAPVRYQAIAPNHFMFTLFEKSMTGAYPSLKSVKTSRGNNVVPHNATQIIPGVYDISIHTADAYGPVSVEMFTTSGKNVTATHNFGSRLLHRQTYEKAGEELSKDLTVACSRVNTLKDTIQVEITAGMSATRNLTTQLALYGAHSLQSYVNSTAIFLNKVRNVSDSTASVLHDQFKRTGKDLKKALSAPGQKAMDSIPTKKDVKAGIVLARSRALLLRDKFSLRSYQKTAPRSIRKDLIVRAQQLSLQLRKASHGVQETFYRLLHKDNVKAHAKSKQTSSCPKAKKQAPKDGKLSKHAVQAPSVDDKPSLPLGTKFPGKTCSKTKKQCQCKKAKSATCKANKAASKDNTGF